VKRIPLSATPIASEAIGAFLHRYEAEPVMRLVEDFESSIKAYSGANYVVALNSGTAAIHLALKALGVGPGDTVLAPTFTYVATLNPIIYLGAEPVLIDSEPETWNMSPSLLESAIQDQTKKGKKPRCVIVVHGYGMPAMMDEIQGICALHEIPILEDAAEALGSEYRGVLAGRLGEIGIFSFNNNKIVTSYGGGALITQDENIYRKAMFWANQSREEKPYYEHTDIGFNYRMGPLNAAAGLLGMKKVNPKVTARRDIFEAYRRQLPSVSWLEEPAGLKSNRWLTTGLFNPLIINQITQHDTAKAIEFRRLWKPMHLQPFYLKYPAYLDGTSERLFAAGLCLPSSDLQAVAPVTGVIRDVLSRKGVTSAK